MLGKMRRASHQADKGHGFDPQGNLVQYVRSILETITFEYWGDRLSTIYDIVKSPPPTNVFMNWLERHTPERNALTVAIIGLLLAAVFGFLSFLVGLLQLILAWVVWKNPTS